MRRNIYAALGAQWVSAALNILMSVAVARMMQPTELGVFAVTMALIGVLSTFQMAGSAEYLLYAHKLDERVRRNAFGITVIFTIPICLVLVFGGNAFDAIYGNSGVATVARICSIQVILGTLISPMNMMIRRDERFGLLSGITLVQNMVQAGCSVTFVWLGWSYMGLAYSSVISIGVCLALTVFFAREHLLLRPAFDQIGGMAFDSFKYFSGNILTSVQSMAPQMLIGALSSVGAAGMFGRANMIQQIYSQTIAKAVDPLINARMAAEARNGDSSTKVLVASSRMMLTISVAFFGFVAMTAHLIVPLVFGEQWAPAAPAMRALSIGYCVWPLASPANAMLLAAGRPGAVARVRGVNVCALLLAIILLAPHGLEAIGWGVAGVSYLNLLQALIASKRYAGLHLRAYLSQLTGSLFAALLPLGVTFVALMVLTAEGLEGWALLLAIGAHMAIAMLVSLVVFKHPLWLEFKMLAELRRSRSAQ